MPPSELHVIDGTSLLFRAYYGMGSRTSADGREVGAVIGVALFLQTLVRRHRSYHVVIAFDAGRGTFRNRIDHRYKANRGEPPEDLKPQFGLVKHLVQALGFAVVSVPDYEADDVMATLALQAKISQMPTRLFSSDKDLCQLVCQQDPTIVIEDPKSGTVWNEDGVKQRLGIAPQYVVDYLALVGDSVDNIAGVHGVGPKAAQALINTFGNLEQIYANLDRVEFLRLRGAKSLVQKLQAGEQAAFLARKLVTLHSAVPLADFEAGLSKASFWQGPQMESLKALSSQLGFPSLLPSYLRLYESF